jgi:hypothetical protein
MNENEAPGDLLRSKAADILVNVAPLIEASVMAISEGLGKIVDTFGGPEQLQEALFECAKTAAFVTQAMPALEKRLKEAEKSVFEGLPEYAWFFDPEMGADAFFDLADLIDGKDEAAIDQSMIAHFRARFDEIERRLSITQEKRNDILAEAFKAHSEQRYVLAIPVFLAQADGVSRELIGAEYFTRSRSEKLVNALLREVAEDFFMSAALRTLLPVGAIRGPSDERKDGSFNRHSIMHGCDFDYANEMNSLKAISLLNFMNEMNESKRKRLAAKPSGGA